MKELIYRTVFGALYVICVVGSILWNPYICCGLFFVISLLAVDEFNRLMECKPKRRIYSALATTLLWVAAVTLAWRVDQVSAFKIMGMPMVIAYAFILLIMVLDEIWNHSGKPLQNWGTLFISQFMIAVPMATIPFLYFLDKWLLLALFVLIWVNDSGAYVVGSLTARRPQGNHKMTPHISPKKSWEGLLGGFGFTLVASLILYACGWFDILSVGHWGILVALVFAFLVSAFGTMGDLIESLMKRQIGVKDSGVFLPGHGGVLDRFDSILLAAPILTAFCWLCYFAVPLL